MTADNPYQATTTQGNRIRLHVPLIILVLVAAAILYIVFFSGAGPGWQFWLSVGVGLMGLLAMMAWIGVWSGLPRWVRIAGVCLPPLVIGGLIGLTKFEEYDGDSRPVWSSMTWRWAPPPHERLAQPSAGAAADIETTVGTNDFSQFLGPKRDGIVRGVKLSRDWKNHPPREVWRRKIGAGWSAFAVVGDYIFTQEQRGPKEIVSCYELRTGHPVWTHDDTVGYVHQIAGDGPRATPTVTGGRVYTVGGTGLVNCLDAATGERIWKRPGFQETDNTTWGKSDSPLVLEDRVIITGGGTGPSLIALDRATGKELWTAQWDKDRPGTIADCYASPVLATFHGVPQLLNLEDPGIAAYDPETGRQLWRHPWPWEGAFGHPKCSQPLPLPGNRVFFAAAYSSGCSVFDVRRDADGKFTTREVWKNLNLKTKFSNAVRRGDYLYGLHNHFLRCLNYKTGRLAWKARTRYGHGQVLLVDDLLLIQAERPGDIALVEATPKRYREIGRIKALKQTTWNTLTLSGKYLLARNSHEAVCFELTVEDEEEGSNP